MLTAEHSHSPSVPWLYDNGCLLCQAQEEILAYAKGETKFPSWLSPEQADAEIVRTIHFVLVCYGKDKP